MPRRSKRRRYLEVIAANFEGVARLEVVATVVGVLQKRASVDGAGHFPADDLARSAAQTLGVGVACVDVWIEAFGGNVCAGGLILEQIDAVEDVSDG